MTNTDRNTDTDTDRPSFADAPSFGIDLSGATAARRADTHRATLAPFTPTDTDR